MKLGEDPKRTGRLERGRVVVFNGRFASRLQTMGRCRNSRPSHVCDLGRDTHDTDAVRVYCNTDMAPRLHLHTLVGQDSGSAEAFLRETKTLGYSLFRVLCTRWAEMGGSYGQMGVTRA
jgi:hypothetical protein